MNLSKIFIEAKTEFRRRFYDRGVNWVDGPDVDSAVEFWCREIGCPDLHEEVVYNYKSFFGNKDIVGWSYQIYRALLIATNNRLMRILSQVTKIPLEKIAEEDFKENVSEAKKETMGNIELVVLISFVLTAIGIVIYYLKKNKGSQDAQRPLVYPAGSYSQPVVPAEKYILLLVLDAERSETVVEQIRDSARIELDHTRTLSSSSVLQGMWYGKQSDFVRTGLGNIGHNSSQRPQSEYDVYSIQIEMDRYYPGFDSGSSSINRLEAFERMVNDNRYKVVCVSQRLSECKTDDLYR